MGSTEGQARRRSLGVALTFVIATVAGVVGGKVSGKITLAWLLFVVLVAAGMLLTYWLDRASSKDISRTERAKDGKPAAADFRKAQGIQLGNHNEQNNYFDSTADE